MSSLVQNPHKDYPELGMLVDGDWITRRGRRLPVFNPASEEVLAHLPCAEERDMEAALAAAERGFETWSRLGPERRTEILSAAARLLRERQVAIGTAMTLEQGKPFAEACAEVVRSAALLEWDANEGLRLYGQLLPSEPGLRKMVLSRPIGPVAGFSPWNFPISSLARKIGGALGAGCSIVAKAAEETPATAILFVRCLQDAGVPAGVVNLLFGNPQEISERLIGSSIIRAVTFTGSVPVGKTIAALAASRIKPAVLELGGHSPVIVCEDTDPRRAAQLSAAAKFRNAGQICTAPTRFIVQEGVHDEFVDAFVEATAKIVVGNGLAAETTMGPLANSRRLDAMVRLTANAVANGATVRRGGKRIGNRGHFFEPTILTDVPLDAAVMNEEPFGPMAPIVRFGDLDEAIDIANRLPFGLASYAFTQSAQRAGRLADEVESGIMSINHLRGSSPETPFGGVKESGYGREGGAEGLKHFTVSKYVSHQFDDASIKE
jgi:succinate-semialdehyde dehydrogenase/glutarate-semialdehyde dehydrogenase